MFLYSLYYPSFSPISLLPNRPPSHPLVSLLTASLLSSASPHCFISHDLSSFSLSSIPSLPRASPAFTRPPVLPLFPSSLSLAPPLFPPFPSPHFLTYLSLPNVSPRPASFPSESLAITQRVSTLLSRSRLPFPFLSLPSLSSPLFLPFLVSPSSLSYPSPLFLPFPLFPLLPFPVLPLFLPFSCFPLFSFLSFPCFCPFLCFPFFPFLSFVFALSSDSLLPFPILPLFLPFPLFPLLPFPILPLFLPFSCFPFFPFLPFPLFPLLPFSYPPFFPFLVILIPPPSPPTGHPRDVTPTRPPEKGAVDEVPPAISAAVASLSCGAVLASTRELRPTFFRLRRRDLGDFLADPSHLQEILSGPAAPSEIGSWALRKFPKRLAFSRLLPHNASRRERGGGEDEMQRWDDK
ncbi:hypothetical protein C7M84_020026 [Penaeus vannamei]|uniref:Uncharacterized protein n=1 Tax=Penaeus vannamei TaxID=6689 RepID=A0A3R7P5Z9_PENVA|nr:hypothetical protein C7M84_020026 [Penaeus vannamei]